MFATFTAVYDACVLYPAPLRDLLMRLALTDLFRARWPKDVHEEWIRSVLRDRPDLKREQLERTRDLMDENVRDCIVAGYEALIPGLTLPDPDDRHVLAAAIRSGASVIVTYNTADFPEGTLKSFGVEAQHPDVFVTHLFDLAPPAVVAAAREQRAAIRNPPLTVDKFLEALAKQQLPETVNRLRQFAALI